MIHVKLFKINFNSGRLLRINFDSDKFQPPLLFRIHFYLDKYLRVYYIEEFLTIKFSETGFIRNAA